jgi:uncharacterized RDD family membrane protein YckC
MTNEPRMTRSRLERIRNRTLPLIAAGLLGLLGVWVVLAPAETRLGQLIKLVYVHGALVMVGLCTFSAAGVLAVAALATRRQAYSLKGISFYNGTWSAGLSALIIWILYTLSAMAVTGLTWGQVIAWNEPRVQASALILVAAILLALVSRLVGQRDFTAAVNVVMGVLPWILVRRAEAIRHPIDPIGTSESAGIQLFFLLIVLTVAGLAAALVTWLWLGTELRAPADSARARGEGAD